MKSKDVIAKLQKLDPSGEIEVFVDNEDIFTIDSEPSYYDGTPTLLIRDKSKEPYYDILGTNFTRDLPQGRKININTLEWWQILSNNPEALMLCDGEDRYWLNSMYSEYRQAVRDKDWKKCDEIINRG